MKDRMKNFIEIHYPEAILNNFTTSHGIRYYFYPSNEIKKLYCCVIKNGLFEIVKDY